MQKYIKIALDSRGIDYIPLCEWCRTRQSVDVDHIDGRGGKRNIDNRMYDPYNLICLCRECHTNKGGREWKSKAKEIVRLVLLLPPKNEDIYTS